MSHSICSKFNNQKEEQIAEVTEESEKSENEASQKRSSKELGADDEQKTKDKTEAAEAQAAGDPAIDAKQYELAG